MFGARITDQSLSSIWLCFSYDIYPSFVHFWQLGNCMTCYFPHSGCSIADSVQNKTMWYITTCQELPVTQAWHHKKCSFTSYTDDHDTGTQLSLQRTRHVNMISLAGLSERVWPIGQLSVNKISVLYHPLLPFPDLPSPLHLLIMTAVLCACVVVCRWERACWSIVPLFTLSDSPSHLREAVLPDALLSCVSHGL